MDAPLVNTGGAFCFCGPGNPRCLMSDQTTHLDCIISDDKARLDRTLIHQFLTASYWAKGISRGVVDRAIDNSACFGVYRGEQQLGFARVISDRATFAYLADVFIIESERGRGLGGRLVKTILDHPHFQGLRRILLATLDAHALYEQHGFKPLNNPRLFMEIHVPAASRHQPPTDSHHA